MRLLIDLPCMNDSLVCDRSSCIARWVMKARESSPHSMFSQDIGTFWWLDHCVEMKETWLPRSLRLLVSWKYHCRFIPMTCLSVCHYWWPDIRPSTKNNFSSTFSCFSSNLSVTIIKLMLWASWSNERFTERHQATIIHSTLRSIRPAVEIIRPPVSLDADPSCQSSSVAWMHSFSTFGTFIAKSSTTDSSKLDFPNN